MGTWYHYITAPKASEPLTEAQAQRVVDWLLEFQQNLPMHLSVYTDEIAKPAIPVIEKADGLAFICYFQSIEEHETSCPHCKSELDLDWAFDLAEKYSGSQKADEIDNLPCPECGVKSSYTDYTQMHKYEFHTHWSAFTTCWVELVQPNFFALDAEALSKLEASINRPLIYWCDKL